MKGNIFASTALPRRTLLKGAAALGGAALGMTRAFAQEPAKPAEIIVRAWGGSWVDSLKAGVSDPFTARTGVAEVVVLERQRHQCRTGVGQLP